MYVYSPMELPLHLLHNSKKDGTKRTEKLSFHSKRWRRKKKKQLTEDAEFELADDAKNDFFDDEYLEYSDDSFTYDNSENSNIINNEQSTFENMNNSEILDEQDILILRTLISLKFSLPDLTSPQPFIESTFQLINENITNSITEISDQVTQIKRLIDKTENQIENTAKINKQILEKTQNFKKSMKQTHKNMKILGSVPLFHRILFKLQDLISFFAPCFYKIYEYAIHNIFNKDR